MITSTVHKGKSALFIIVLVIFCLLFSVKVKAAEIEVNNTLNVNINIDKSAQFDFIIDIKNQDNNQVVSGYTVTLPYNDLGINSVKLNGVSVDSSFQTTDSATEIKAEFGDRAIKPNDSSTLEISFFKRDTLNNRLEAYTGFFPALPDNSGTEKIKITYPAALGNPLMFTASNPSVNASNGNVVLESLTNKSTFLVIGTSVRFNASVSYTINNQSNNSVQNLLPLIPDYSNQNVEYENIVGLKNGLFDDSGNNYGLITLNPSEKKDTGFSSSIMINDASTGTFFNSKFDWSLDLNSVEGQKIYSELNKASDNLVKLNDINDYLVGKLTPSSEERIDLLNVDKLWDRLSNSSIQFNSFDYCSVMIAVANYLNIPARIDYGYVVLPATDKIKIDQPHIWCEALVNGKNVLMDPYLDSLTGTTYFNQSSVDRIKMGIWNPDSSYDNVLNLLTNTPSTTPTINILPFSEFSSSSNVLSASLDLPAKAYSGENYDGALFVNNDSNKFINIKDVLFDGDSIMGNLTFGNLKTGLLPRTKNEIKIAYLREKDFILDAKKQIEVKLIPDSSSIDPVSATTIIKYEPDNRILIAILVGIILLIVILLFLMFRIRKHREIDRI